MQPAAGRVAVLGQVERVEIGKAGEAFGGLRFHGVPPVIVVGQLSLALSGRSVTIRASLVALGFVARSFEEQKAS